MHQQRVWQHGLRPMIMTWTRRYGQSTFANQTKLPRLPVPDLDATLSRYKRSLIPLFDATTLEKAYASVDRFGASELGRQLQQRLLHLDAEEAKYGRSWLDQLWLNKAYLEYREPTLINVNWWYQFIDPPQGLVAATAGKSSPQQLKRAAVLMESILGSACRIKSETVPVEETKAGPLCMNQLKYVFGISRIAGLSRDTLSAPWPLTARHVNVLYKDQMFSVPVLTDDYKPVPRSALERQLQHVVDQVDNTDPTNFQPPIGLLTSEHRDTWGQLRHLLEQNPSNAKTFAAIDAALFTVCLDDYETSKDKDVSHRNLFHGHQARNRWFDSAIQIIVENNGAGGVNGEHSPADAVVPSRIAEEALAWEAKVANEPSVNFTSTLALPTLLQWQIPEASVTEAMATAEQHAKALIDKVDSVLLHYDGYGSSFIKKARVSPDVWMQMAYQLAYYRLYGEPCATYESASTRKFLNGRTEAVRSCTAESLAFTQAWDNKDIKMSTKIDLLQKAAESHTEYMKAAAQGNGVDRHFLGLRCQMTEEEAATEEAKMFRDPTFAASQYWTLSTSNTSPGDTAWGGFGAVVPEGYGINYAVGKERVRLSISSWRNYPNTDSNSFRKTVRAVLDDFGNVAEKYMVH